MKIGPVDIRNHSFTRKMRGVDEGEVRDYMELVAERLEESILEGEELRGRIDKQDGELAELRALERSMRDSLLSAERLVDDRSAQAEKEAQIVIKNAEVQADKLLAKAREELVRLRAEVDDLRRQRVTYAERFRALLDSQMKILEASLESFDPEGMRPATMHGHTPVSPAPAPAPPPHRYHPAPSELARSAPTGGTYTPSDGESVLFSPETEPPPGGHGGAHG